MGVVNIDCVYDLDAFIRKGQIVASCARSMFGGSNQRVDEAFVDEVLAERRCGVAADSDMR